MSRFLRFFKVGDIFALELAAGNRTRAAKLLRLTRSALLYRMQKFNLFGEQGSSDGSR